jgi:hypothetical protein
MLRHADYCTDGFVVCFSFVFCLFFVCFGGGSPLLLLLLLLSLSLLLLLLPLLMLIL